MKFGVSLLLNFEEIKNITDFIQYAHDNNFQTVEIVTEPPYCYIEDINSETRTEIRTRAKELNMELTVHASFSDINIAAINPDIRKGCLQALKKSIVFAHDIEASIVTIHPGEYGAIGISYKEQSQKYNRESIIEIAHFAEEKDILIGYENNPKFPWEQFKDSYNPKSISTLITSINKPNLGITWDVGHSNTLENSDIQLIFKQFKKHLLHIHIHDNNGPGIGWVDKHMSIGQGTIDWRLLFELLMKFHYKGSLIMELNNKNKIKESIEFLQRENYL